MGLSWRRDFEIVNHLNINGMGSLRKLELNDMINKYHLKTFIEMGQAWGIVYFTQRSMNLMTWTPIIWKKYLHGC